MQLYITWGPKIPSDVGWCIEKILLKGTHIITDPFNGYKGLIGPFTKIVKPEISAGLYLVKPSEVLWLWLPDAKLEEDDV